MLASMACDYLGVPDSSAAVEMSFSAAADVCSANRGLLPPQTIKINAGSLLWLCKKVELMGEWIVVGSVLAMSVVKGIIK